MDHSLVIFDSGDEMIFSPESPTNSNIHFRIHRSSEKHYTILNDLFGTPADSPDKDEPDEQELHFPAFSSLPSPFPTLHEFSKEDLFLEDENTLTSDVRRRSPQQELLFNLEMEDVNPLTPTRPFPTLQEFSKKDSFFSKAKIR